MPICCFEQRRGLVSDFTSDTPEIKWNLVEKL